MRSRSRAAWLLVVALALWTGGIAALALPSAVIAAPDEAEVEVALDKVRKDPNISAERTVRTLKWVDDDEREQREPASWLEWLADLFRWIAGVSRLLLWTGIVVLLGLLGLFLKRVVSGFEYSKSTQALDAPTHVQELDIRPESLPDEIGVAALALWERNEHRAALALLYRGLLSRLVHAHGVPIRASTTEADCLRLAVPRLHADVAEYTTKLVRVWQHAVYGAKEPPTDDVQALCARFDRNFPFASQPSGGQP